MLRYLFATLSVAILCSAAAGNNAQRDQVASAIRAIQNVGLNGDGNTDAIAAVQTLSNASASHLPQILVAMKKNQDVTNNWLRAAAETIADRARSSSNGLPLDALQALLDDQQNPPRGREVAFAWLAEEHGNDFKRKTLASMTNDPSLVLRRMAIEQAIADFDAAKPDGNGAIVQLRGMLRSARDVDQIEDLTKKLEERDAKVDLPRLFGFVTNWHLVAPFDNTDTSGFDKIYPPEKTVDTGASYVGKNGKDVTWVVHGTDDKYGMVDLKKVFGKNKGSAAYAFAEFDAVQARPADLRLGCINANKIWLNGQLLTANHVYHAGTAIDQYVAQGKLRKGRNEILVKICENEQEEAWAQDWQFQLRVCDELGTAILSKDQLEAQTQ